MPSVARLRLRGRVWWCWFYDADGRRIEASCRTRDRRTAERVALELERRAPGASDVPTTEVACGRLVEDRRTRGRSAATISFIECKVGHLVRIFGAATPITAIDARSVDDYCRQRIAEGASRYTVAHELGQLRALLRFCRRRGEYPRDPAEVMPLAWESGYVPRRRTLTEAEVRALMAALPARAAHLAFLISTGARWGESERARPEDWGKGVVRLRGTKTAASARVVPVLKPLRRFARLARRAVPFPRWPNVRRDMAAACRRAAIVEISPNDLRRSVATWLIELGVPANLVAAYLGHTTSRMVEQIYGRVEGRALGQAIAAAAHLPRTTRKRAASGGRSTRAKKARKP